MLTINLANIEESDIKYKVSKFPDGQQNIIITPFELDKKVFWAIPGNTSTPHASNSFQKYGLNTNKSVEIKSRLNNWLDLELIVATVASLKELGIKEIHLYVPYFLGARSDRKFETGGNNYLRDVICPIINSLNFKSVICIDPHSDVLEACIKGFRKESNLQVVQGFFENNCIKDYILVSPDAGASKKIHKLAEQIGYKGDIITCSKDRDENGKLTKCVVSLHAGHNFKKDFIIIDDICDGGNTFINIAKEILNSEELDYKPKIYLVVTHGIFSKGFEELSKYFDGIYCTNSYSNVGDYAGNDKQKTNVKQLKVI